MIMQKKCNLVSYKLKGSISIMTNIRKRLKRPEKQPGDLARVRLQPNKENNFYGETKRAARVMPGGR